MLSSAQRASVGEEVNSVGACSDSIEIINILLHRIGQYLSTKVRLSHM
jgi:hypothetical protein